MRGPQKKATMLMVDVNYNRWQKTRPCVLKSAPQHSTVYAKALSNGTEAFLTCEYTACKAPLCLTSSRKLSGGKQTETARRSLLGTAIVQAK